MACKYAGKTKAESWLRFGSESQPTVMHKQKPQDLQFLIWWEKLTYLAGRSGWKLGERDGYREYFDDGDSPDETLEAEMYYGEPK